ncbi:hypothetical protein HanIR_Chr12g0598141 [Helianthus annuus]|nr:hypothetical protein HanIR_Chr12g0598141 [Helianthus annuus]
MLIRGADGRSRCSWRRSVPSVRHTARFCSRVTLGFDGSGRPLFGSFGSHRVQSWVTPTTLRVWLTNLT